MTRTEKKSPADLRDPVTWIATWGLSGLSPVAPGTVGSVAAVPVGLGLVALGGLPALIAGLGAVTLLGLWASARYMARSGRHDPGEVVIDEVAGQWIALLPAGLDPLSVLMAFVLFRFFDIVKPWPVRWADRHVGGGLGVMLDDLLAGALAAGLLWAGLWLVAAGTS